MIKSEAIFRPGYHGLLRPEILNLIPKGAKRILDLGCGSGELGKAIKQRQKCTVLGVELNKEAAAVAEKNLDAVQVANVDQWKPPKNTKPFDCIICADILEHLYNPWALLRRCKDVLTLNGVVVASIPNIAHPAIINQLQRGLFLYQPAGILDFTHCRFFTRTSIFQMFTSANLKIKAITPSPSSTNPIQCLIEAAKITTPHPTPRVTILVLAYDGIGYTKRCIESVAKNTRASYKIIVVDNGSTDGTWAWLLQQPNIYSIHADQNLGFAAGFNLGIECVDTPFFVLLNNDVVVTEGWLQQMLIAMANDSRNGIVGPTSNYVSGPQLDPNAKYGDLKEMALYAQQVKAQNDGEMILFPRIVFFCTLFKSDLIKKVGMLDPRFGMGNFEDDDYCKRTLLAGYKCVIDRSVFVHHYGGITFKAHGIDYKQLMNKNLMIFKQKWGIP